MKFGKQNILDLEFSIFTSIALFESRFFLVQFAHSLTRYTPYCSLHSLRTISYIFFFSLLPRVLLKSNHFFATKPYFSACTHTHGFFIPRRDTLPAAELNFSVVWCSSTSLFSSAISHTLPFLLCHFNHHTASTRTHQACCLTLFSSSPSLYYFFIFWYTKQHKTSSSWF